MMRIFGGLLVVVMAFASCAQAQNGSNALVLDVYSVNVPSDEVKEKGFGLWVKSLKAGGEISHEHPPVIHTITGWLGR
jgi:hypothetical protein